MQFAAGMNPTLGPCHVLRRPFEQTITASITVNPQDAAEALQNSFRVLTISSRRISERHSRWIIIVPWPVITGQRPEV